MSLRAEVRFKHDLEGPRYGVNTQVVSPKLVRTAL
jgi:hypothetical protein